MHIEARSVGLLRRFLMVYIAFVEIVLVRGKQIVSLPFPLEGYLGLVNATEVGT